MALRATTNTGQVTFDGSTFFGVELVADQAYAASEVVYTFTEQEMNDLCDLIRFARTRALTNETTATQFSDSV